MVTCNKQHASFRQTLNTYGAVKTPCFFMVSFDCKQWHVEPLENPSGKVWYVLEGKGYAPHPPASMRLPTSLKKLPMPFEAYASKIASIQEEIRKGNTYLLNFTCKTPLDTPLELEDLFHASHAPFRCLFKDRFVCFSPERFVKITHNTIHTFPMKGTIDAALPEAARLLLEDEKEKAEHVMVVDLLRNDLGRIASYVRVKQFRYLEKIRAGQKELFQTSSHITGVLAQDWPTKLGDTLAALLPAGSISGTPKKKTVELITALEGYERGFFTGVFGVFDGQNLDSAVMIRFVEKEKGGFVYKSGGGITLESCAQKEYAEMVDKIYVPLL